MHTLIPLALLAIILLFSWPYIKAGFDIVPDNRPFPVDGRYSLRDYWRNHITCRKLWQHKTAELPPTKAQRQAKSVECAYRLGQVMRGDL